MVLTPPGTGREFVGDDPPYSRLFVVYNRKDPVTEQDIRDDFGQFGEVQDIFIVKERSTMEPKGIAYVKFSKMSEAAIAMENLNLQPIRNRTGVYKVYIAKNKGEARGADEDPARYLRLFVIVPKSASESDVKLHFSKFGDVQTVKILRNRETNESKGIGYVTYSKVSEAAIAVEEAENEEGFKAVIARPKEKNPNYVPPESQGYASSSNNPARSSQKYPDLQSTSDYFTAHVSAKLSKDNIYRLFDVAPGLRDIDIVSQNMYRSEVIATYNSTLSAEYALNKLHGLEYPLGEFISVESKVVNKRPVPPSSHSHQSRESSNSYSGSSFSGSIGGSGSSGKRDYRGDYRSDQDYGDHSPAHSDSSQEVNQKLSALSKALTDATALLKSAGLSTEALGLKSSNSEPKSSYSQYCDFSLPPTQPVQSKSDFDEQTGMRLFFVGHPTAPSVEALYDVYCRFGNFAGATVMARKNYGYLYFTTPESAHKAIKVTDDKMIAGVSIKVLKADPKKGDSSQQRKRIRTEM